MRGGFTSSPDDGMKGFDLSNSVFDTIDFLMYLTVFLWVVVVVTAIVWVPALVLFLMFL